MRYLSLCSGIEAASVAWKPLGWEPVAFSEIEPFPCSVLAHHYPTVPNWGDMTKFEEWPDATVDVLVGGTPCQSFSVAGLRKGLADPRGNLMLVFGAIAERYCPTWLVWENVPGVLSSNGGRDFGTFLGMLGQLGYGFSYRVLDAQFTRISGFPRAVPQRRRRVFVVGYLGDWRPPAAVLFERESLSGNPPPSRKAREGVASYAVRCAQTNSNGWGINDEIAYTLDQASPQAICMATGQASAAIGIRTTLTCNHEAPIVTTQYGPVAGSLTARHDSSPCADRGQNIVAFAQNTRDEVREMEVVGALAAQPGMKQTSYIREDMAVRRLNPVECERLQGFPDDYTFVPYRGKPAADGNRYKALGNSMAVNCLRWIGERIELVEGML